jgi:hypothetical protein
MTTAPTKCQRCGHTIVVGRAKVGRGLAIKYSCLCQDIVGDPLAEEPEPIEKDWNTLTDVEKLIRVDNSMIHYLEPDELESWSTYEQIEKDTKAEIEALCSKVRDRKLIDYQEQEQDPEVEAILSQLRPEVRNMYPEETDQYQALLRQCGEASMILAELMRIAAERAP